MDDDEDADYIFYGTPLSPLDDSEITAKRPSRVEDQIATDKHGKRRFHGAFMGGFSAGYFNTVGTEEGWTPSTFVSSRSKRAKIDESATRRPEHYMDEEDLGEYGIAPQKIVPHSDYNDSSEMKKKRLFGCEGPIPGVSPLETILQPSRETVGMKLLRKLGWRPGQGVGPRLSRREKRRLQRKGKSKCERADEEDHSGSDESSEHYNKDVLYAPDNVTMKNVDKPKSDWFGLGYEPLRFSNVLGGQHINLFQPLKLTTKKKKNISIQGQAFGVGAFEEEDEDIYSREDMSNYSFTLDMPGESENSERCSHKSCTLGHLEGFIPAKVPDPKPQLHPPPQIPSEFIPLHKPSKLRFERTHVEIRGLQRHQLTSKQRGDMLESERPSAEVKTGCKIASDEWVSSDLVEKSIEDFLKHHRLEVSERSGFRPFSKDKEKQKRYELFVRMTEKGMKDKFSLVQPKSFTEWEKERERMEFEKAAELFRPLVSSMASRFTTAKTDDSLPNLKDGLNTNLDKASVSGDAKASASLLEDREKDDQLEAARSKMFGKLTQVTTVWYPHRLLCKRFNVPDPFPNEEHKQASQDERRSKPMFNIFSAPLEATAGLQVLPEEKATLAASSKLPKEQEDKEDFNLKIPTEGPPSKDLFKAIFQSSDSESESDELPMQETERKDASSVLPKTIEKSVDSNSAQRNQNEVTSFFKEDQVSSQCSVLAKVPKKGTGLFANLDFEKINKFRNTEHTSSSTPVHVAASSLLSGKSRVSASESSECDEDDYCPDLPPHLIGSGLSKSKLSLTKSVTDIPKVSSSVSSKRGKTHKKKKHKYKKKKKKKSKKKKRNQSNSDASSSSDSD